MIGKSNNIFIHVLFLALILLFNPNFSYAASKIPEGSSIAGISIHGKTEQQAKLTIESEIATWFQGEDLIVKSDFETMNIPRSAFMFDVDATLEQFKNKTKRKLTNFFLRPKHVHVPLVVDIDEQDGIVQSLVNNNYIDSDHVLASLTNVAQELNEAEIELTYVKEIPLQTVAQVELDIPDISDVVLDY